jgi:hypothetical protein
MRAVPLRPGVNFIRRGSRPALVIVGAGEPIALTVKQNRTPAGTVSEAALSPGVARTRVASRARLPLVIQPFQPVPDDAA